MEDTMRAAEHDHHFGGVHNAPVGALQYEKEFEESVFGPDGPAFLKQFCTKNMERAHAFGSRARLLCGRDEEALGRLAGRLKYIGAYLELAQCYAKHIGVMTECQDFRYRALTYIATAYAELEALECTEQPMLVV